MTSNYKYLEIDSNFRNRNQYPNPCDFIIPTRTSNNNINKYNDPIISSIEFSGSKKKPGLNFTEAGSTQTLIYLDIDEADIDNYYIGSLLSINNEDSKIIYYDGLQKTALVEKPYSFAPLANTQYFTRYSSPYFSSNILPYEPNLVTNSVNNLQLLSLNSSDVPGVYKDSFVRFINGGNTNMTAIIVTNYEINTSPGNPLSQSYSQPTVDLIEQTSNQRVVETIPNTKFSTSLVISDNSKITVVGAPNFNNGDGTVYIYDESITLIQQLIQSDLPNSGFGYSLSVSNNGSVIVVGCPNYNSNTGCVVIYKKTNNVYLEFSRLFSTNSQSYFGYHVSSNIDATLIAVSSPYSSTSGQVFVYKLVNSSYIIQSILESGLVEANSNFGSVTSMDSNGIFLAISSPFDNDARGSVSVYKRTGNNWTQTSRLTGFTSVAGMTISNDSNWLVIGDPTYLTVNGGSGGVWIFQRSGNLWAQKGNVIIASGSTGEYIGQGISVSISRDGRNLIVGAPGDNNNVGAAFFYTLVNGNVISVAKAVGNQGITRPDGQGQGNVVAISGNGMIYLSGNPTDNNDTGAFWAFRQNSNNIFGEQGFLIYPSIDGYLVNFSLNMKSTNLEDDVVIRLRNGSDLSAPIIYERTFTINVSMTREDYVFNTIDSSPLIGNNPYTLTISDLNPSGNSAITLFGIYANSQYIAFNTLVYPKLQTFQRPAITTKVITIEPSLPLVNFLGSGLDIIEFNSFTRENSSALYVYDSQQLSSSSNESYYEIELTQIVIPKQLINTGYGGYLENYPYFYVELYNESQNNNTNTLASINPNSTFVLFKVPVFIRGEVKNFYTFKNVQKTQIIKLKLDQYLHFRIRLGSGEIFSWKQIDNFSPSAPNALLQITALFRLLRLKSI